MLAGSVAAGSLGTDRWSRATFGAVLSVAMGAGTFPGYAFGALGPLLVVEFGLTRSQLGLLTTLFFVVGGLLSLAAGPLVDRFGGRNLMLVSFGIISVALLAMALSPTFIVLLAMAALAGFALATGNPTTNKLVAVHIPLGQRGVVTGVKQAGVQVGAFFAGAVIAPLAVLFGWRSALVASTAIPVLGLVGTLMIIPADRNHDDGSRLQATRDAMPPAVWWLTGYAFLMGSGVSAVNAYLPLYSVERLSFSPELAGGVAAFIGFMGIVGRVAWGWASDRLSAVSVPLLLMSVGSVVSVVLVLVSERHAGVVWLGALLFGATAVTWNAVGMLAVIAESGPAAAGRASGYVLFGFYMGFVGSPIAFGAIVDRTGHYDFAWALIGTLFVFSAVLVEAWRRSSTRMSKQGGE